MKLLSNFWLAFGASGLSLAWIIPNHFPPWVVFHGDAWAALQITFIAVWVTLRGRVQPGWQVLTLVVGLLSIVPVIQFAFGHINNFGTAWINCAYLLGFLLAIQTGECWEHNGPDQCADYVYGAVVLAATVSTGIQLYQWAGLESLGPWTLNVPMGTRLYANLAQPNQLASLLLLGILGCSWGFHRGKLKPYQAILLASFLVFGLALTESRTGWLNALALVVGAIFYARVLPTRRYLFCVVGMALFYVACIALIPALVSHLGVGGIDHRTLADPVRLDAWTRFIDASVRQPIFGFGWGQIYSAFLLVAPDYTGILNLFSSSHNLFLDLVLWNGYPIGLLLVGVVVWFVHRVLTLAKTFGQLHLIAFLAILSIHAMLEFPLQYAYFLLPFGLMVGALQSSLGFRPILICVKPLRYVLLASVILMLIITIRDYFRVETSYYGLRFEAAKVKSNIPSNPPDVWVLKQWRDYIVFARNIPRVDVDPKELQWMIDTVNNNPSSLIIYKLAANLALNGRHEEAGHWIKILCKAMPAPSCATGKEMWMRSGVFQASKMPWPDEFEKPPAN